ncbi:MAG: hypothetical protein ACR2G3_02030 [Solirubrobacterales bacterium]
MLARFRAGLSFANVVSLVALFVALGGSAYAVTQLDRNSVRSKHIVNGQVKLNDTASALRLRCPAGTRYLEGACLGRSVRPAANYVGARTDCYDDNLRLPSANELRLLRHEPGVTLADGGEWSSDKVPGGAVATVVGEMNTGGEVDDSTSDTNSYRCVHRARGG